MVKVAVKPTSDTNRAATYATKIVTARPDAVPLVPVRVADPVKVQAEREVTDNPRYKTGRNLRHDDGVFSVDDPKAFGLPKSHLSSRYIFAMERDFMVYPNNLNRFVRYLDGTFQHGGISMEEMLVPLVHLVPR